MNFFGVIFFSTPARVTLFAFKTRKASVPAAVESTGEGGATKALPAKCYKFTHPLKRSMPRQKHNTHTHTARHREHTCTHAHIRARIQRETLTIGDVSSDRCGNTPSKKKTDRRWLSHTKPSPHIRWKLSVGSCLWWQPLLHICKCAGGFRRNGRWPRHYLLAILFNWLLCKLHIVQNTTTTTHPHIIQHVVWFASGGGIVSQLPSDNTKSHSNWVRTGPLL